MIIETKFSIGDTLLFKTLGESLTEPCEICNHTGKIILKDKHYKCPECNGNAKKYISPMAIIKEIIVSSILLRLHADGSKYVEYHYFYDKNQSNDYDYICEDSSELIGKKA